MEERVGPGRRIWIALLFGILALARPSAACDCREFSKQLDDAVLVFRGTITHVESHVPPCVQSKPSKCPREYTYDITVDAVWKGSPGKQLTLVERRDQCASRPPFKAAQDVVFILREAGAMHGCDGTQASSAATIEAVTKRYGTPHKP